MKQERGNFNTKMGIILATAGSAVGLGNVWRFPFITGQNGGAAFILIYLVCVMLLGIPGMVCEFIIGRHSKTNAARAYRNLSGKTPFAMIGYLGVFTSMIILGFYAVVAGWCLQYLYASIAGELQGNAAFVKDYFLTFSSTGWKTLLWTVVFILITHVVITRGVRKGIEQVSNWLMPMLFALLVILVVASCMLPNAMKGVEFLLSPDFSKITHSTVLEALGQAFFSLSLGTACLCTYASYFKKKVPLLRSACQIAVLDSVIAVLSGLIIFPAAFSVNVSPDSGPSLIFITLPNVFQTAFAAAPWLGQVISILFYALLTLAALTSTISMHEIGTAFFHEELKLTRHKAAWIETLVCCLIGVFCALSVGAVPSLQLNGMNLMDCCDRLTSQVLLPIGALFTCMLIGWYVPKHLVRQEFTNNGTVAVHWFAVFLFVVRFICPVSILLVFAHQINLI